ncbi:hypothetical protein B296_00038696 [Ensete ventricosum]|uniref:Uncharacterized protein n=1 Tax=Ensete ventricosum TaxID=4639 RepID=A0A426ZVN8_ENSVE|nr:hypothetical protein B296_00038696 [Ensete ventricosum]
MLRPNDVVGTRRKIAGSLQKVIEGLLGACRMLVEGDGGLAVSSLKVIKSLSGVRGSSSKVIGSLPGVRLEFARR